MPDESHRGSSPRPSDRSSGSPFLDRMESVVEQRIREAMERGEFDDLPGAGKPLPTAGEPYDEMWWVKKFIARGRTAEEEADTR